MNRHAAVLAMTLGALLAVPAAAQVASPEQLRYPPMKAYAIPQPERVTLDNGMVVLLLPDHELPLVEVHALVHAGPRYDPADRLGLASLGAELMRTGGAGARSADELDDFLESHAASIELSTTEDQTWASLSTLTSDLPALLPVFADVLRRPAFDPSRLEVARAQELAALARSNDDPYAVMYREVRKRVFGADSPIARTPTFATLRAVRRDDVVAWHRASLHPDRIVLGVVGDFRRDELLAQLQGAFGDWPRGPAWSPPPPAFEQRPRPGVYFGRKEDSTQSAIGMAHLGLRFDDPDYYAAELLDQLFSGSFSSRLFASVRTRQGLSYNPYGGIYGTWDRPGMAGAFMSTKVETTGAGIGALLTELAALTLRPPTAQEVDTARQSLLASFVFQFDTPDKVMQRQMLLTHYGYPADWLARYQPGIQAATDADVRRVAARIRPDDFAIVVIGPQRDNDQPLSTYGKVEEIDIALPPDPGEPAATSPSENR